MRLITLKLRNFKGIKAFDLQADGGNVSVYGDNATGKTTVFDAITWLLFDKDSGNRKDFEIKTLDPTGTVIHGLDHEVEGTFESGGRTLTLRKVYAEKWTKKRGSATAVFSGHTTDYFVDGVPVKKNEYTARVAEICDEDIFKLLTSPIYFNEQLHWQRRREILLDVCGDISDAEVIASDKALAKLPEILGDRSLDDHRKVIAADRTRINKQLEQIQPRIDEVTLGLPELPEGNRETLTADITSLQAQRSAKAEERTRLENGGEIAQKKRRLAEVETALLDLERQARAGVDEKVQAERQALGKINAAIDDVTREIRAKQADINQRRRHIERLETQMQNLRDRWHQYNGLTLDYKEDVTCPTCGQDIPESQLADAREKALADFNQGKARKLEEITAEGKAAKAEAEDLHNEIAAFEQEIAGAETRLSNLDPEVRRIDQRINALEESRKAPAVLPPSYGPLAMERDTLGLVIAQLQSGNTQALERITGEIEALDQEITVLQGRLASIDQRDKGLARIEELKTEERRLAAEYERLEGELFLTEQFIRVKVALLEEQINSKFQQARFKLFREQVNGGVEECCETLYGGVPYSTGLNNAARINVGLDIINTLSEHYGFEAPIVVDNAEAVTQLIPTRGQLIKLVVSAKHKALTVETEGQNTLKREAV